MAETAVELGPERPEVSLPFIQGQQIFGESESMDGSDCFTDGDGQTQRQMEDTQTETVTVT